MKTLPASLVQLHYHNRPGGVERVIDSYHHTFSEIAGEHAPNIVICAAFNAPGDPSVVHLPEADYCTFTSASDFLQKTDYITRQLLPILDTPSLPHPVAIIGHNLNLGKNCALAAAFTRIALQLGKSGDRFRFFLCMHDFFEDGRLSEFEQANLLEAAEVDIRRLLYAAGAPVHYVVPARHSANITGLSDDAITVLPHLINFDKGEYAVQEVSDLRLQLARCLSKNGSPLTDGKNWYWYPSRMIYRKNLPEAFLLATILLKGALFTGGAGTRSGDNVLVNTLLTISRKYRLGFIPNVQHHAATFAPVNATGTTGLEWLYPAMDAIITTSRAEGFGFTLFEPWHYKKQVIGRMPCGTSLLEGMHAPALYQRLPIPLEWADLAACHRFHADCYEKMFKRPYQTFSSFCERITQEDTIDFGLLDEADQCAIITRLAENPDETAQLTSYLASPHSGWPGLAALTNVNSESITANKAATDRWDSNHFKLSLINMLSTLHKKDAPIGWYTSITSHFSEYARFTVNSRNPKS